MKTNRLFISLVIGASLFLPGSASATLTANNLSWATGTANLTYSRIIAKMGERWLDVEEEAEIQIASGNNTSKQWIVEGTFVLPKGAAITGCMLWNEDTLLIGKLRGKAQANAIFDSLVPPRQPTLARDPLLIEQLNDTTYGFHLFPFANNGSRRFRLRYLVPLLPGSKSLSIKPLMAKSVNGSLPAQFRLKITGTLMGAKLVQSGMTWPLDLPSSDLIDLSKNTEPILVWPTGPAEDATRAIRTHFDSGAWKGDFVLYTSRVPDSILAKVTKSSETVVLWKWLHPNNFLQTCYASNSTPSSCSSWRGNMAIQQAKKIREIASHVTSAGNKFGLLADLSLGDSIIGFETSNNGTKTFQQMDGWLAGINEEFLRTHIPNTSSGTGNEPPSALDISRDRQSFIVDVKNAGTLFSQDSGIIRHLLIVTVGFGPSSAYLEPFDTSLLPKNVSVSSSELLVSSQWNSNLGSYFDGPPVEAKWPGVDLAGLVQARKGGMDITQWNGIELPAARNSYAGRLSFQSGSGKISRNLVVRNAPDGSLIASLNVHGLEAAKSVNWTLFNDDGSTLQTWDVTPKWVEIPNDSVIPRLWAKSEAPMSPIFQEKDLAPIFGIVDPFYSLLATPSDSVGKDRQAALRDSGVPFLTSKEIFARQGYGGENTGIEARTTMSKSGLKVAFDATTRTIRIDLQGISARSIEIRDLRGKLLASWSTEQLVGLKGLSWRIPSSTTKGLLLVTARTSTGIASSKIFAN